MTTTTTETTDWEAVSVARYLSDECLDCGLPRNCRDLDDAGPVCWHCRGIARCWDCDALVSDGDYQLMEWGALCSDCMSAGGYDPCASGLCECERCEFGEAGDR